MTTPPTLRLAAYLPRSRANGPGLRSVLWVQGCHLRCPGCFNPEFLPFAGGREATAEEVAGWMLAEAETEGVSFSGGEPFAQATALAEVAERLRAAGKGILIFTGQREAALRRNRDPGIRRLLANADLLVAGPYRREAAQSHPLLASANQRLVYLTERYRGLDLGPRRSEYRIGVDGGVRVTGFPGGIREDIPPLPNPSPARGEGLIRPALRNARSRGDAFLPSPLAGEGPGERGLQPLPPAHSPPKD